MKYSLSPQEPKVQEAISKITIDSKGTLFTVESNTNKDFYKGNYDYMTEDAYHLLSLKAKVPSLEVEDKMDFKLEMKPFINQPTEF